MAKLNWRDIIYANLGTPFKNAKNGHFALEKGTECTLAFSRDTSTSIKNSWGPE